MGYKNRFYQETAMSDISKYIKSKNNKKIIVVQPCAAGKSHLIAQTASLTDKPVLVIQPSKELLTQNYGKFIDLGFEASIYSASKGIKEIGHITYVTPGSIKNEASRFKELGVEIVIIDECHIGTKTGGMVDKIIKEIKPKKVIGFTATPCNQHQNMNGTQMKMMNRYKESIMNDIIHVTQVRDLVDNGYWSKVDVREVKFNESKLRLNSSSTDFTISSVMKSMEDNNTTEKIIKTYDELVKQGRKKILIFVPSIVQAEQIANAHKDIQVVTSTTKSKEREYILEQFNKGTVRGVVNVNTLSCLSEDTEVLSKRGWLKKDEVRMDDDIAQYKNGKITFDKPLAKHEKIHTGKMVTLDGRYASFKVTDDHDMLIKNKKTNEFKKVKAEETSNKPICFPVSGFADPEKQEVIQKKEINKNRFISYNSYNYRKKGLTKEEAFIEANKQYNIKSSLKFKNPNQLTLDECRFIGFFLGDGSCSKAKCGGNRYTLCQSLFTPKMIDWIENLLKNCDIHYSKETIERSEDYTEIIEGRLCKVRGHVRYGLSIGTGGHKQNRKGLYKLLPYLNKKGTNLFKSLNREQYFALMEGLFKADGNHGNNKEYKGQQIVGEYKELFDLLQDIGTCRGYKVTIRPSTIREGRKQLYYISLSDRLDYQVYSNKPILKDEGETKVWCLTTKEGTLVTRYNGYVTIMGNCGFDNPLIDGLIMGTPTRSYIMYYQQYGRAVRIHPDKKDCILVDMVGNVKRFGRPEELEIIDYPGHGWGMFFQDYLLTGVNLDSKFVTKEWLDGAEQRKKEKEEKERLYKERAEERENFEKEFDESNPKLWFGKYKGEYIKNIPSQYLEWIVTNEDFNWFGKNEIIEKTKNAIKDLLLSYYEKV